MANPSATLLKAVAVTAELCGLTLSTEAARVFATDLSEYPENQVLVALTRCRRELSGQRLSINAVISRIDDGRPGPEEAWAMLPRDERTTVVWTTEMAEAWGIARELDEIAGRMAFREVYVRLVTEARATKRPPVWQASLGQDPDGREVVLQDAVRLGRLTQDHVEHVLLPYHKPNEATQLALAAGMRMLADKREPVPTSVRAALRMVPKTGTDA